MKITPKIIGDMGEIATVRMLRDLGYEIITGHYKTRFGEIDIAARDGDCMVFVEVKTRNENAFADPKEFVTPAKQRRLIAAAMQFMKDYDIKLSMRFDVSDVIIPTGCTIEDAEITHLINAFDGSKYNI